MVDDLDAVFGAVEGMELRCRSVMVLWWSARDLWWRRWVFEGSSRLCDRGIGGYPVGEALCAL